MIVYESNQSEIIKISMHPHRCILKVKGKFSTIDYRTLSRVHTS